ncbi:MAG: cytidine deaminase [Balneolaceae bacterium]
MNHIPDHSYSPYSKQKSSCLIQGQSGTLYPGVRIENIAFPLSISALQAAICSCLANGDRPVSIAASGAPSELTDHWISLFELSEVDAFPDDAPLFNPFIEINRSVFDRLNDELARAVTPHSNFPVAALLETEKGIVAGANVEVEAWALGLCAERVALSRAVSAGCTEFKKIYVYAPKGDISSPCGACRQVLAEWMPEQMAELHHGDGTHSTHLVSELLPFAFRTASL